MGDGQAGGQQAPESWDKIQADCGKTRGTRCAATWVQMMAAQALVSYLVRILRRVGKASVLNVFFGSRSSVPSLTSRVPLAQMVEPLSWSSRLHEAPASGGPHPLG